MDRRIESVLATIERDLRGPLRLSELARAVGLSMSRFHELFLWATGETPAAFIRARRYDRAKCFLLSTFLTVKEVAETVGIHDDSHFVREFERLFGMSPRRFRRAHESAPVGRTPGDDSGPDKALTNRRFSQLAGVFERPQA
jgi:transcriptional regulator GlxA family with amidase domain